MLTGEIRSQIDRVWDAFGAGGTSNPLEVIAQITYLLFLLTLEPAISKMEPVEVESPTRARATGKRT